MREALADAQLVPEHLAVRWILCEKDLGQVKRRFICQVFVNCRLIAEKNHGHNVRCELANARPTGNNSLSVKLLVCRDQAI